jgi:hypothetical protein
MLESEHSDGGFETAVIVARVSTLSGYQKTFLRFLSKLSSAAAPSRGIETRIQQ